LAPDPILGSGSPEGVATTWDLTEGDDIAPSLFALRLLGGGTAYEAYLAWSQRLLALVVVKVVRPHLVGDPGTLRTLEREIDFLETLNHPVIVRSYGATVEGDRPHLVLEYLEGDHLARLIRRAGALEMEQLLPLAMQLASAVHYLAGEGVVHLDIKPRNTVMGAPPRLIDLSVARRTDEAHRISGYVGTDLYMAPEQCEPERGLIGPAADVWGLGVTLYTAATGRRPFHRDDGWEAGDRSARFPQLVTDAPPMPRSLPGSVSTTIMACLRRDPAERPAAAEVAAGLEEAIVALPKRPVLRRLRPRL